VSTSMAQPTLQTNHTSVRLPMRSVETTHGTMTPLSDTFTARSGAVVSALKGEAIEGASATRPVEQTTGPGGNPR
jgi:hypothetical protein